MASTLEQQDEIGDESQGPVPQQNSRYNFALLAAYQIVMRIGWIFKTESIVMPAVVDILGGPAWVRGCLPMLSRFGQSIPPVLAARRVKLLPQKKLGLAVCTLGMAGSFLLLAWVWNQRQGLRPWTTTAAFLSVYTLFFVCVGIGQMTMGTLQGKLIPVTVRGRQLMIANLIGSVAAVIAAWLLLPQWLTDTGGAFDWIFATTGVCFLAAALVALGLRESADNFTDTAENLRTLWATTRQILIRDRQFRGLVGVSILFGVSITLFPHYQALARESMSLSLRHLTFWVVLQNIGTALFSLLAGPVADRYGNRLVLRCLLCGLTLVPLLALLLATWQVGTAFGAVFLAIGLTPVTFRTLFNFTLELSLTEDHPRYLGILGFAIALPIFFSPLVGLLVGKLGFVPVFVSAAGCLALAAFATGNLAEPRHGPPPTPYTELPNETSI